MVLIAGCGTKDAKAGTDISISGDDGNVVAAAIGKTGKLSLNLPGVSANILLPKIQLEAGDMDINGVKLYPRTTINAVNVQTGSNGARDKVDMRFAAPAAPAVVRDYFLGAFRDNGATIAVRGMGLSGTGKDGDPFSIDLDPSSGGGTLGRIVLSSND
jgi:hypothetical protein